MSKALNYSDVYLIPQYSPVHSRSEISTAVKFGPRTFKTPAVPANMKCTIDDDKAKWMSENGHFYIMHRFGKTTESRYYDMFKFVAVANAEKRKTISISVGVQKEDRELIMAMAANNYRVDYITIDIAHSDSIRAKDMLAFIKNVDFRSQYSWSVVDGELREQWTSVALSYRPFIIAGNVATPEAVANLAVWGADAIKCGISNGGSCTTFGKTGFGIPQFSSVMECANVAKVPLIADGGIKTNGDFAKAIRAGGTMVMAGSLFAACIDSPAESVYDSPIGVCRSANDVALAERGVDLRRVTRKKYYGSASSTNKGNNHHVEGTTILLPVDPMTYSMKLNEIKEDLQSACSYAGGSMDALANVPWGVK